MLPRDGLHPFSIASFDLIQEKIHQIHTHLFLQQSTYTIARRTARLKQCLQPPATKNEHNYTVHTNNICDDQDLVLKTRVLKEFRLGQNTRYQLQLQK